MLEDAAFLAMTGIIVGRHPNPENKGHMRTAARGEQADSNLMPKGDGESDGERHEGGWPATGYYRSLDNVGANDGPEDRSRIAKGRPTSGALELARSHPSGC